MTLESLEEIRTRIDGLDREIIALMARRGTLVRAAAAFKTSTRDVEAPRRVEAVIAKVRERAALAGLEPEVAEAAYRAMIAAFIEVEQAAFRRRRAQTGAASGHPEPPAGDDALARGGAIG